MRRRVRVSGGPPSAELLAALRTHLERAYPEEGCGVILEGPGGARIFVDPKSYAFLHGTELDYDTSLMSRGFLFNNPNAKSTCGCGLSFNA